MSRIESLKKLQEELTKVRDEASTIAPEAENAQTVLMVKGQLNKELRRLAAITGVPVSAGPEFEELPPIEA
jgi:hypothetical protein